MEKVSVDLAEVLGLERDSVVVGGDETVEIRHVNELSFVDRTKVTRIMGRRDGLFRELGILPGLDHAPREDGSMSPEAQAAMVAVSEALSEEEAADKAAAAQELTRQIVGMIAIGPVDKLGDRGSNFVINHFLARSRVIDAAVNRPALGLGRGAK